MQIRVSYFDVDNVLSNFINESKSRVNVQTFPILKSTDKSSIFDKFQYDFC